MQNDHEQEVQNQLQSLAYPVYPAGCQFQIFQASHRPLYQCLKRFDQSYALISNLQSSKSSKDKKDLIQEKYDNTKLIQLINATLNNICSNTHRYEYRKYLQNLVVSFTGNLKVLKIQLQQPRISYWQHLLEPTQTKNTKQSLFWRLYYSIKQQQKLTYMDILYQHYHKIPNSETFMLLYENTLKNKLRLDGFIHKIQNKIPSDHKHYLAVLASATYGCRYLWNRGVNDFLKNGGDINWIVNGITETPHYIQDMANYSTLMAFNFKQIMTQTIFQKHRNSNKGVDNAYKLQGLIILCYYQALSCLNNICGFIPENSYYQKYLPVLPYFPPSGLPSFQSICRQCSAINQKQNKLAEEFANLYNWQQKNETEKSLTINSIDFKFHNHRKYNSNQRIKKINSLQTLQKDNTFLLGQFQEKEISRKVNQLESLKNLRESYKKFVHFDNTSQLECSSSKDQSSVEEIEDSLVLASQWDFNLNALTLIQSILGSKYRNNINNFINSLRTLNKQKSKNLKHYYQFFNNYMHQYVDYKKLLKQISIVQKKNLKLITKTPFLFTEQSFAKMKKDLSQKGHNVIDFVFEAISFKFELSLNLITYLFNKNTEQDQEMEDY